MGRRATRLLIPALVLLLLGPAAPGRAGQAKDLIGHWTFTPEHTSRRTVKDRAGQANATVTGQVEWQKVGSVSALVLDGKTVSVSVREKYREAAIPVREITAEAWVRVDQPHEWGGIVGVFQDNGAYEKGWLLGYRRQKLSFAVKAARGPAGLTYLQAAQPFETGQWYHVVGVYDGKTQQLYVNGKLAASSAAQSGDLDYPPRAFYQIGAYRDDDEYYRLTGLLHEVRVWKRALTAAEVVGRYKEKSALFPPVSAARRVTAPVPGKPGGKKVLIIGIDGCRPDALLAAKAPNLHGLIERGAFSDKAQAGDMTASGSGWASLLTGVWREKHGIRGNAFEGANFAGFPDLLTRVKNARPQSRVASVVHWEPIHQRIIGRADHSSAHKTDARVTDVACQALRETHPEVLFVHLDDVDGAGHAHGFDPRQPKYLDAIHKADVLVGKLLKAMEGRPSYASEDWLVVVSTDHGGSGKGHGRNTPEHRTIFLIVSGPAAARGRINPPPGIVDVAPTVLRHLGVDIAPAWGLDGRPVGLKDMPRGRRAQPGGARSSFTHPWPGSAGFSRALAVEGHRGSVC
jgi:hypothetical protein